MKKLLFVLVIMAIAFVGVSIVSASDINDVSVTSDHAVSADLGVSQDEATNVKYMKKSLEEQFDGVPYPGLGPYNWGHQLIGPGMPSFPGTGNNKF